MTTGEKINKFMSGKKKITASLIIPILIAIINTFVSDPETAETLRELVTMYIPTLVAIIAGWFYTANEAAVDKERAKIKVEEEKTKQLKASEEAERVREALDLVEEQAWQPFDPEGFSADLKTRAAKYLEINPITIFQAARDKMRFMPCKHVSQAQDAWAFLYKKAIEAFVTSILKSTSAPIPIYGSWQCRWAQNIMPWFAR